MSLIMVPFGRSQEASLVPIISILALACDFAGLLLLVRQGVPHRLLSNSVALEHNRADRLLCGNDRQRMLSFAGMVLFALGTALQMASIVLHGG